MKKIVTLLLSLIMVINTILPIFAKNQIAEGVVGVLHSTKYVESAELSILAIIQSNAEAEDTLRQLVDLSAEVAKTIDKKNSIFLLSHKENKERVKGLFNPIENLLKLDELVNEDTETDESAKANIEEQKSLQEKFIKDIAVKIKYGYEVLTGNPSIETITEEVTEKESTSEEVSLEVPEIPGNSTKDELNNLPAKDAINNFVNEEKDEKEATKEKDKKEEVKGKVTTEKETNYSVILTQAKYLNEALNILAKMDNYKDIIEPLFTSSGIDRNKLISLINTYEGKYGGRNLLTNQINTAFNEDSSAYKANSISEAVFQRIGNEYFFSREVLEGKALSATFQPFRTNVNKLDTSPIDNKNFESFHNSYGKLRKALLVNKSETAVSDYLNRTESDKYELLTLRKLLDNEHQKLIMVDADYYNKEEVDKFSVSMDDKFHEVEIEKPPEIPLGKLVKGDGDKELSEEENRNTDEDKSEDSSTENSNKEEESNVEDDSGNSSVPNSKVEKIDPPSLGNSQGLLKFYYDRINNRDSKLTKPANFPKDTGIAIELKPLINDIPDGKNKLKEVINAKREALNKVYKVLRPQVDRLIATHKDGYEEVWLATYLLGNDFYPSKYEVTPTDEIDGIVNELGMMSLFFHPEYFNFEGKANKSHLYRNKVADLGARFSGKTVEYTAIARTVEDIKNKYDDNNSAMTKKLISIYTPASQFEEYNTLNSSGYNRHIYGKNNLKYLETGDENAKQAYTKEMVVNGIDYLQGDDFWNAVKDKNINSNMWYSFLANYSYMAQTQSALLSGRIADTIYILAKKVNAQGKVRLDMGEVYRIIGSIYTRVNTFERAYGVPNPIVLIDPDAPEELWSSIYKGISKSKKRVEETEADAKTFSGILGNIFGVLPSFWEVIRGDFTLDPGSLIRDYTAKLGGEYKAIRANPLTAYNLLISEGKKDKAERLRKAFGIKDEDIKNNSSSFATALAGVIQNIGDFLTGTDSANGEIVDKENDSFYNEDATVETLTQRDIEKEKGNSGASAYAFEDWKTKEYSPNIEKYKQAQIVTSQELQTRVLQDVTANLHNKNRKINSWEGVALALEMFTKPSLMNTYSGNIGKPVLRVASNLDVAANTDALSNWLFIENIKETYPLSQTMAYDLDAPLYLDIYGNILTESGYVVIPFAANATLHKKTSFLNRAFLSSYGNKEYIRARATDEGTVSTINDSVYPLELTYNYLSDYPGFTINALNNKEILALDQEGRYKLNNIEITILDSTLNISNVESSSAGLNKLLYNINLSNYLEGFEDNTWHYTTSPISIGPTVFQTVEVLRGSISPQEDKNLQILNAPSNLQIKLGTAIDNATKLADNIVPSNLISSISSEDKEFKYITLYLITHAIVLLCVLYYILQIVFGVLKGTFHLKHLITKGIVSVGIAIIVINLPDLLAKTVNNINTQVFQKEAMKQSLLDLEQSNNTNKIGTTEVIEASNNKQVIKVKNIKTKYMTYLMELAGSDVNTDTLYEDFQTLLRNDLELVDDYKVISDGIYYSISDLFESSTIVNPKGSSSLKNIVKGTPAIAFRLPYYAFLDNILNNINEYNRIIGVNNVTSVTTKTGGETIGLSEAYFNSPAFRITKEIVPTLEDKDLIPPELMMLVNNDKSGVNAIYGYSMNSIFTGQHELLKNTAWYQDGLTQEQVFQISNKLDNIAINFITDNKDLLSRTSDSTIVKMLAFILALEYNKEIGLSPARIEVLNFKSTDLMKQILLEDRNIENSNTTLGRYITLTENTVTSFLVLVVTMLLIITSIIKVIVDFTAIFVILAVLVMTIISKKTFKSLRNVVIFIGLVISFYLCTTGLLKLSSLISLGDNVMLSTFLFGCILVGITTLGVLTISILPLLFLNRGEDYISNVIDNRSIIPTKSWYKPRPENKGVSKLEELRKQGVDNNDDKG